MDEYTWGSSTSWRPFPPDVDKRRHFRWTNQEIQTSVYSLHSEVGSDGCIHKGLYLQNKVKWKLLFTSVE